MSKQDLEEYWDKREAYTSNPSIEAAYDRAKFAEFIAYKEKIEAELAAKDPRARRAVYFAARFAQGESKHIAEELYPDEKLRPAGATLQIAVKCERKMCMRLYDMFVEAAVDAASEIAPL